MSIAYNGIEHAVLSRLKVGRWSVTEPVLKQTVQLTMDTSSKKFDPELLKAKPAFDFCDDCILGLEGTEMRPNESILLKCHTCLSSERNSLYQERAAAATYIEWQRSEIKNRESEEQLAKAKLAAQEVLISQLQGQLRAAIQKTPVEFRTPAPVEAYNGPTLAIVVDRTCGDLIPAGLNFPRIFGYHKGLKWRVFQAGTIAKLCEKAKTVVEKTDGNTDTTVVLWGGHKVLMEESYVRRKAVDEAFNAIRDLAKAENVNRVIYATPYVDIRDYEQSMFTDALLASIPSTENIDLRYISRNPAYGCDKGWSAAGKVEAVVKIGRETAKYLDLTPQDYEEQLTDVLTKLRNTTEPEKPKGQDKKEEKPSEKSRQPAEKSGDHRPHQNQDGRPQPSYQRKEAYSGRARDPHRQRPQRPDSAREAGRKRVVGETSMDSGKDDHKRVQRGTHRSTSRNRDDRPQQNPAREEDKPSTSTPGHSRAGRDAEMASLLENAMKKKD